MADRGGLTWRMFLVHLRVCILLSMGRHVVCVCVRFCWSIVLSCLLFPCWCPYFMIEEHVFHRVEELKQHTQGHPVHGSPTSESNA